MLKKGQVHFFQILSYVLTCTFLPDYREQCPKMFGEIINTLHSPHLSCWYPFESTGKWQFLPNIVHLPLVYKKVRRVTFDLVWRPHQRIFSPNIANSPCLAKQCSVEYAAVQKSKKKQKKIKHRILYDSYLAFQLWSLFSQWWLHFGPWYFHCR